MWSVCASLTAEEEHFFRRGAQQAEEAMGHPERIPPFGFGHGEKIIDFFPHPAHEVIDPLFLAMGRHP